MNADPPPSTSVAAVAAPAQRKGRIRRIIFVLVLLGLGVIASWWLMGKEGPSRSTEDAYVHGNEVTVSPLVAGTVTAINADETDFVRKGQPVVQLDDSDTRVALQQAEATLGDTFRKVRLLYENVAQMEATVEVRKIELSRAQDDYQRRTAVQNGSVSQEEITHAQDGINTARANVKAATQQLAAARALVAGTDLEHHPLVLLAEAGVLAADLAKQRTVVYAPETGYIARRNVQLGQRVQPGASLLIIIPLDQIWVNANFKEEQLKNVRIGQPVTLTADFYGQTVRYDGRVAGLGAGTGAAFSLLPPQEASGNWIKIVQRVPVRVIINALQLEQHPLRLGLSMTATIDTHDRTGDVLARTAKSQAVYETEIYAGQYAAASALVQRLVNANLQALARGMESPAPASDARSLTQPPAAL